MHNFRRAHEEDGASTVEFALVLPLLLMLLFGIFEFGRVYSQYQVYQGAAREGARFAAVRDGTGMGPTAPSVLTKVRDAAAPYSDNISAIRVTRQCTGSTVGQVVKVEWEQSYTINIPLVPSWNRTGADGMKVRAAFRCE